MNDTNEIRYMLKDHVGTAVCLERALSIVDVLAARVKKLEQSADADAQMLAEHGDALITLQARIPAAVPSAAPPTDAGAGDADVCECGHEGVYHREAHSNGSCSLCACRGYRRRIATVTPPAPAAEPMTLPATDDGEPMVGEQPFVVSDGEDAISAHGNRDHRIVYVWAGVDQSVKEQDTDGATEIALTIERCDALIAALKRARAVAAAGGGTR